MLRPGCESIVIGETTMARLKLELPDTFEFATELTVRITDINYGGHMGNDALLALFHEARLRFLGKFGLSEKDAGGAAFIMSDAAIVYKAEAFHGDTLCVEVAVAEVSTIGCEIVYRAVNKANDREIARAKTGMVFFDYAARKIVKTPEKFAALFGRKRN